MYFLPPDYEPYTDAYFLRSLQIIKKEGLNPFVRAQIFIRKGPGKVYGLSEAVSILDTYSHLRKNGGRILALHDGDIYAPSETIFLIEGEAQDIIQFETMILGVISAGTTKANDGTHIVTQSITKQVQSIVREVGGRPVIYFGPRHWRYNEDQKIARAAFKGGAQDVSTDNGAATKGKKGVGTIPHSLECIFAWKYGYDRAVVETVKAFDRVIDASVPRIALADFANREIDDALASAEALGEKLYAVRLDTPRENIAQEAFPIKNHEQDPFWYGRGVTVSAVYALRKRLDEKGYNKIRIMLSGGFGDIGRVRAFTHAEKEFDVKLFDIMAVGEVFPCRAATMDIVGVGKSMTSIEPLAKRGRHFRPNDRLKEV